jgi:hypothetical protein
MPFVKDFDQHAGDAHRRQIERVRRGRQVSSESARDIGPIPDIADVRRRNRCRKSLRLFCETYNPEPFYLDWSPDHLRVIATIERSVTGGFLQAFAMPRGSGKTTLCRMAVLWAASYALTPYPFLIGATADKAEDGLDAIKTWMRYLPEYIEDFPEISTAVVSLAGIAHKQAGQLCCGESTGIRWEKDRLVLPRVPKPHNLRCRGKWAPTSGLVIGCSGLTGEGIRGSLFTLSTGDQVRPSLVLIDDPQTDESASSPSQNNSRYNLLTGAVLGMAGPDKAISGVMPCTVIRPGDMADTILDRKKNPLWRGIRTSMLRSMPKSMDKWEGYFDTFRECMGRDDPDISQANAYYASHRDELDEGAEATWPERKLATEVSAIQHAMNLYARDKAAFFAEYQNTPIDTDPSATHPLRLKPAALTGKLSRVPRGVVPKECEHLTAFVDVGGELLHWMVSAWTPDFAGGPIDYGLYPEQPTRYTVKENVSRPLASIYPGMVDDAYLLAALEHVTSTLLARRFEREDGRAMTIEKLLVDIKWGEKNKLLRAWCRRHPHHGRILHAAQGFGFTAGKMPITDYRPDGARTGDHWRLGPPKNGDIWVTVDTNYWKSLAASRLLMPIGTPGAWSFFGADPQFHAMLIDHCCAEWPDEISSLAMGRTVTEWKNKGGTVNNDLWDCLVGTAVAGSMAGCAIPGSTASKKPSATISMSDLARRARGGGK